MAINGQRPKLGEEDRVPERSGIVRVGVVGADLGVQKVCGEAAELPMVQAVPLVYSEEEDVESLVSSAARKLDVVLFCGPVPYELARDVIPPGLPVTHISYDGSGLVKALFDFHRLPERTVNAFSIDSVPRELVMQGVREVGLEVDEVFSIGDGRLPARQALVRSHERLWNQGSTGAAVTYVRSVQRELDARGVRTIYVQPLTSAVRLALERALLLTENRSNEAAQLVIVLVRTPLQAGEALADATTHRQKHDLTAQALLLDVGEETDAALLPMGAGLYALYTTKAGLDRIPNWLRGELPFLDRIADVLGPSPKAGIGFGGTSREAQSNALRALRLAEDVSGPCAFAILRDGHTVGPLGNGGAVARESRVEDAGVLEEARRAGVSARSLARVYGYLASFRVFDTEKLAGTLDVSERSARRIVNRLVAAGIVESAGEESVHRRGRPRGLYRLAAPAVDPGRPASLAAGGSSKPSTRTKTETDESRAPATKGR